MGFYISNVVVRINNFKFLVIGEVERVGEVNDNQPPRPMLHKNHSWHRKDAGFYLVSISIILKNRVPIPFSSYDFLPHVNYNYF